MVYTLKELRTPAMMASSRPLVALLVSVSSLLVLRWCLVDVLCLAPTPGSYNSLVGEEIPFNVSADDDEESPAPEYAFAEGGGRPLCSLSAHKPLVLPRV